MNEIDINEEGCFYRYETVEYAVMDMDGEYYRSKTPNPRLKLHTYNLWRETPKGHWIGYGHPDTLHGAGRWVSKTSKRRYAFPTKREALDNFIQRTQWRVDILDRQLQSCKMGINAAKQLKKHDPIDSEALNKKNE